MERVGEQATSGHPNYQQVVQIQEQGYEPDCRGCCQWNGAQSAKSTATSSSGYAIPTPGAALPLTFNVDSRPVLVIGANRLAATRTFAFLEAGAKVFVVSPLPITEANDEVQHRVKENGVTYYQADFTDVTGWDRFMRGKKIALACVTDTLIGSGKRGEQSLLAINQACKPLGVPINISDHPALSTFTFPATHRFSGMAGPSHLQISISTNGNGCRLSGRIKREIIAKLPGNVGAAVDTVGKLRLLAREKGKGKDVQRLSEEDPHTPLNEPVEQIGTPSLLHGVSKELGEGYVGRVKDDEGQLRRMRWVHQMSEYYSFDALANMTEGEMEDALDTWRGIPTPRQPILPHHDGLSPSSANSSTPQRPRRGRILLVGSGPGHPGLLTMAAYHALKSATLILSDKLVPAEILALIPSSTPLHIAKKFPGNNEGAQNELMLQALAAAREGEVVVRLKQGDPFVYGRGGEEVLYFRENGFEAVVVPGVTSAIAGPEMVGIPVTQRGVAEGMVLCTGVGRAGKSISLPGYVKARSLIILMGVARIGSIVDTLTSKDLPTTPLITGGQLPNGDQRESGVGRGRDGAVYPGYLPIAIIERASSPDQRVILSTLEHVAVAVRSVEERPPGMIVVGWAVLALDGRGRVDVLDRDGEGKKRSSREWMDGQRWKVREGLAEFGEFLEGLVL